MLLAAKPLFAQPYMDTATANVYITEVYGDTFLISRPILHGELLDLMINRVSYLEEPVTPDEKFPLISTFPLMDKINTSIQPHDPATFDVTTFNPLIYGWNFFNTVIQVYRIDGTDFLLIVQPQ